MSENIYEDGRKPWENDFRLPRTAYPSHYDLFLNPDLMQKTFVGNATIEVNSTEARDYFLLHTKWLNITETSVLRVKGEETEDVKIISAFEYEPNEFWVIQTEHVHPGTFRIFLQFSGSLATGIVGFYFSDYINEAGEKRVLATTKFEPTYARRAFPCFDEPSFKSTYTLKLVRPTVDYIAISNMPIKEELPDIPGEGLTTVTFEKSLPMVTYLVCFIVCDFTFKETILPSGMPFRVYAPSDRIEKTEYALEIGSSILQYYEQMFDLPFPLPKSDMAAIPDYSSGATEHWGIITYRETNIFYSGNTSSDANQQRVSQVIAHELAHQWFGNLVTLEWWDDLWLNEGFASYIEYKGVMYIQPDWDMANQFAVKELQSVFNTDSKLSSHPIVQVVNTTDAINAMFDSISYEKGSSVIRMLENFMGEAAFQTGINNFLKKYSYDNAVTQALWDELTSAWSDSVPDGVKGDVGEIMDTWTRQMGYPVITVQHLTPGILSITQKRFLQDPYAEYDPDESDYEYNWDIPVTYISSVNSSVKQVWLYRDMDSLKIKLDANADWYKLNVEERGYYRVNYNTAMWKRFETLLKEKVLGTADRGSLYDDAFSLAKAALMEYDLALNLSCSLSSEDEYVPWASVSQHFIDMEYLLIGTVAHEPLNIYTQEMVNPIYTSLGWQNTGNHLQKLLRNEVVVLACNSGLLGCLEEAASLLIAWIDDPSYSLPLGTKREVYRWGVIIANSTETWDIMWERCMAEQDSAERDNLYYGLANSQNETTLLRYIEMGKNVENIRTQDFLNVLKYIALNPVGTDITWWWVRTNWEWLVDRYTLNDRYLGQLIPNISQYFATQEKLDEMEAFFAEYPDAGAGELYREQALETVHSNIHWVNDYSLVIYNWLQSNGKPHL